MEELIISLKIKLQATRVKVVKHFFFVANAATKS
jgi:hypothetical protein